ncbi:hypothetical protein OG863_19960 [Streptomyces decoyicus]|uniref:Uncharacterized protein n=1 Tax=Streptomyces decoyicus TaxID=249567 RepID=A0ABZ1FJ68_9ACTN|nr:hypothetical protein [Streptomyces decoyicus]WSB70039.1 hypothetical protein OG863_19960 [Streptomyces decoyicus]
MLISGVVALAGGLLVLAVVRRGEGGDGGPAERSVAGVAAAPVREGADAAPVREGMDAAPVRKGAGV